MAEQHHQKDARQQLAAEHLSGVRRQAGQMGQRIHQAHRQGDGHCARHSGGNDAAITCLVDAVLLKQDEHWQLEGRRMFSAENMSAIPGLQDATA